MCIHKAMQSSKIRSNVTKKKKSICLLEVEDKKKKVTIIWLNP